LTANGPVTVINGPNQLLPLWRVRHYDLRVEEIPKEVDSAAAMAEFAASQEAQYLIVEALVIKRRTFLQNYFTLEDDDEDYTPFEMIQPLPSMTEMAYYKMGQTPIMILEPEGQP
jgi:hypothetical protein